VGLTAAQLKWIAAAAMTLDHIGLWCNLSGQDAIGLPLRLIGRAAAPIFLFLITESLRYTRSRPKLMLRLYLGAVLHGFVSLVLVRLTGMDNWCGNIFPTLFYTALLITAIDDLKARKPWFFLLAAAVITAGFFLRNCGVLLSLLLPPLHRVEYSALFVLLGIAWYYLAERRHQVGLFLLLSVLSALIPARNPVVSALGFTPLFYSTQCFMLLAAPLILAYNGQKGHAPKLFFYWYYPLHQYVLLFFVFLKKVLDF